MYKITYTMQDGTKATLNKNMMWSLHEPQKAQLYENEAQARFIVCTWVKVQMGNESIKFVAVEEA